MTTETKEIKTIESLHNLYQKFKYLYKIDNYLRRHNLQKLTAIEIEP